MNPTVQTEVNEKPAGASDCRCLILANQKAGTILRPLARLAAFGRRCRRYIFRTPAEQEPQAVQPESFEILSYSASCARLEATVESVPPPEQMTERIRRAEREGYETVVAAGGDGTVHSVAQAMVYSRMKLGILPLGTSNNVAHALNLPLDLDQAMRVVQSGAVRPIDVGRVAGNIFLEAAGVGLFADAFAAFGGDEPRKWQILRLLRVLGPQFWNPPVRSLQLTLDGVVLKESAVWIVVSNGTYLGDRMPVAPGASLEDGLFDVIIVGAMGRRELLRFALEIYRGRHLHMPQVNRVRAKDVTIRRVYRSRHPLPVHADADIVAYTPAHLETLPGALKVIVP